MSQKTLQPGLRSRFIDELQHRAARLGKTPTIVCVLAGLSPTIWRSWENGASPAADTMDLILTKLAELEAA